MGDRGHILDGGDADAKGVESADGALAARAGTRDLDVNALQAVLKSLAASLLGRDLRGEGGGLAGALEALSAGGRRRNDVALTIRDGNDRVVKGRLPSRPCEPSCDRGKPRQPSC